MADIAFEAYRELYPDKEAQYSFSLDYTAKFKPYNANVKKRFNRLEFSLSKNWKKISPEIQIGLIQHLMVKVLRQKNFKKTTNMELYDLFIKKVHLAVPKTKTHPILGDSFIRVNGQFFSGMVDQPNLEWGSESLSKLGCYEYGSDTITISRIFQDSEKELLDYVMYHEMLHKKLKFNGKNARNVYHSNEFKDLERKFPNSQIIERKISALSRRHRFSIRKVFFGQVKF